MFIWTSSACIINFNWKQDHKKELNRHKNETRVNKNRILSADVESHDSESSA